MQNLGIGTDTGLAHGGNGPAPGVIFFFTAQVIAVKADDVVANLVQEDAEAEGGLRERGFDPVDGGAIAVFDTPGAAGEVGPPAVDADAVFSFGGRDDLLVLIHTLKAYRLIQG